MNNDIHEQIGVNLLWIASVWYSYYSSVVQKDLETTVDGGFFKLSSLIGRLYLMTSSNCYQNCAFDSRGLASISEKSSYPIDNNESKLSQTSSLGDAIKNWKSASSQEYHLSWGKDKRSSSTKECHLFV